MPSPRSFDFAWPELIAVAGLSVAYALGARRHPPSQVRIACFVASMLLLVAALVTPLATLGKALPARRAPRPERRPGRVGARARRRRPQRGHGGRADAKHADAGADEPVRRAPALARHLWRLAHTRALRGGPAPPTAPRPRARLLLRRRVSVLVAASTRRAPRRPERREGRVRLRAPSSSPARSGSSPRSCRALSTTSTSRRPASAGSTRSRISSSRGSSWPGQSRSSSSRLFAFFFTRFLAEES